MPDCSMSVLHELLLPLATLSLVDRIRMGRNPFTVHYMEYQT